MVLLERHTHTHRTEGWWRGLCLVLSVTFRRKEHFSVQLLKFLFHHAANIKGHFISFHKALTQ